MTAPADHPAPEQLRAAVEASSARRDHQGAGSAVWAAGHRLTTINMISMASTLIVIAIELTMSAASAITSSYWPLRATIVVSLTASLVILRPATRDSAYGATAA